MDDPDFTSMDLEAIAKFIYKNYERFGEENPTFESSNESLLVRPYGFAVYSPYKRSSTTIILKYFYISASSRGNGKGLSLLAELLSMVVADFLLLCYSEDRMRFFKKAGFVVDEQASEQGKIVMWHRRSRSN